jgi:hypothetical protein
MISLSWGDVILAKDFAEHLAPLISDVVVKQLQR